MAIFYRRRFRKYKRRIDSAAGYTFETPAKLLLRPSPTSPPPPHGSFLSTRCSLSLSVSLFVCLSRSLDNLRARLEIKSSLATSRRARLLQIIVKLGKPVKREIAPSASSSPSLFLSLEEALEEEAVGGREKEHAGVRARSIVMRATSARAS